MKKTVTASITIPSPIEKVWEYISDFSDAGHQVIAVESTKGKEPDRVVTFKNGHQVLEHLLEKSLNEKLKWAQSGKKGFVPIKNVEVEIKLTPEGSGNTTIQFSFYYETVMGPIGWMMNIIMVKKKLSHIAEQNAKKIHKHFTP